jgi:hypothetical protein
VAATATLLSTDRIMRLPLFCPALTRRERFCDQFYVDARHESTRTARFFVVR